MTGQHDTRNRLGWREDLQLLRAIAVLAVLAYHAELGVFGQGFLGVDVFFVLSGYLVTRLILTDVDRGAFSYSRFLARRAARLLPAAFVTLSVTTLAAPFLLTPGLINDFEAALFGALTFTANIVLWGQTDYFAAAAEVQPLLHMWSLSLEEQFYLLWPLVLVVVPRRWRLAVLGLGIVGSIAVCAVLLAGQAPFQVSQKTQAAAAFFLLPARGWELLVGALAAWWFHRHGALSVPRWASLAALMAIVVLCSVPQMGAHPGPMAGLVVLFTGLICAGPDAVRRRTALSAVGDWSYSIYLIHWPLLAYANGVFLGEAPWWLRVLLALVAIPLGALQYRFVEERFRGTWRGWRAHEVGLGLGTAAVSCALLSLAVLPVPGAMALAEPNYGLARACDQRGGIAIIAPSCRSAAAPRVALLGDSYAMHWAEAIADEDELGGVLQLTKSACAPAHGLAPLAGIGAPRTARDCIRFTRSAVDHIKRTQSIELVIVASSWSQIAEHRGAFLVDGTRRLLSADDVARRVARLVADLKRSGRVVVLMAPPPSTGLDFGACHQRRLAGALTLGREGCAFAPEASVRRGNAVAKFLETISASTDTLVLDPREAFCADGVCRTASGGTVFYADRGHLTREGAAFVAARLGLADRLLQEMSPHQIR